jgi:hypothetical protein
VPNESEQYRVNAKGEHIMSLKVFKALSFEKVCNLLKINPYRKG